MTERKYFGTNGVRGVVGELITNFFVNKLTSAISSFIENKGVVVVGSDARTSSPFIKYAVISTLLSSGIDVIDIGLVPTPLTQFAVRKLKARLGIMITASHNPPQFNGLKVISDDGIEISVEDQIKVEKELEEGDFYFSDWTKLGNVTKINMIDEYIDQIISFVDIDKISKKKMKVVVDGGNGVGSLITPYLFKKLGVKVFSINTTLDGYFPGRGSEPLPHLLTEMARTAKSVNADFSIAHDGDADRAIFGDERGVVYWGDRSIAIFEKMIDSDGIVLGTPVYFLGASGIIKTLIDRGFPNSFPYTMPLKGKKGVTGAVAGVPNWEQFALLELYLLFSSLGISLVDQIMAYAQGPGELILNHNSLERAHKAGRALVNALKSNNSAYQGEPGICPVCHNNLLTISKDGRSLECPMCQIKGELSRDEGSRLRVQFAETERHRWEENERRDHFSKRIIPSFKRYRENRRKIREKVKEAHLDDF